MRADEWRELRALRLDALANAPGAFVVTHAEALAYPDERWHEHARRGASAETPHFVAAAGDGRFLGMAVGLPTREREDTAALVAMYVRPEARRNGIGEALVERVLAWARERGFALVELGVAEGNDAAARLYARCGFVPTGETHRYENAGFEVDVRMAREL